MKDFFTDFHMTCNVLFDLLDEGIVFTDDEGNLLLYNSGMEKITGFSKKDVLQEGDLSKLIHPNDEDRQQALERLQNIDEAGSTYDTLISTKSGRRICINVNSKLIYDKGRKLYFTRFSKINNENLSKKEALLLKNAMKRAEQKMLKQKSDSEKYLDNVRNIIIVLDNKGCITFANKRTSEVTGFSNSELMGKNWFDLVLAKVEAKYLKELFEDTMNGQAKIPRHYENVIYTKENEPRDAHWHIVIIKDNDGNITGTLISAEDVTEHKSRDLKLNLLSTAIEQAKSTIIITDVNGLITYANPFFTELTGYKIKEVIGKNPRFLMSGKHTKKFYKDMWKQIKSGKTWHGEFINKKKDGSEYVEDAIITPVFDANKKVINFVGIKTDISAKKNAEERLMNEKEFSENILKTVNEGVDIVDENFNVIYMNDQMKKFFGNKVGQKCYEAYTEDGKICDSCPLLKTLKSGATKTVKVDCMKGNRIFEISHSAIILPEKKKAVLSVFHDITFEENTQKNRNAMIAGLVHDVKNKMVVAKNLPDLYFRGYLKKPALEDFLRRLKRTTNEATDMITSALDYHKIIDGTYVLEKEKVDVFEMIQNIIAPVALTYPTKYTFQINGQKYDSISKKLFFNMDKMQIERVFGNLFSNALKYTKNKVDFKVSKTTRYLSCEVSDNGKGVPKKYTNEIFSLGFQVPGEQKAQSSGIGLGSVKKIVELHGGKIGVKRNTKGGATFFFKISNK